MIVFGVIYMSSTRLIQLYGTKSNAFLKSVQQVYKFHRCFRTCCKKHYILSVAFYNLAFFLHLFCSSAMMPYLRKWSSIFCVMSKVIILYFAYFFCICVLILGYGFSKCVMSTFNFLVPKVMDVIHSCCLSAISFLIVPSSAAFVTVMFCVLSI